MMREMWDKKRNLNKLFFYYLQQFRRCFLFKIYLGIIIYIKKYKIKNG
jgi:hypothetical protein